MASDTLTKEAELAAIENFVTRVNAQAEANIAKTFKLEGSHYAAMTAELNRMRAEVQDGKCIDGVWTQDDLDRASIRADELAKWWLPEDAMKEYAEHVKREFLSGFVGFGNDNQRP